MLTDSRWSDNQRTADKTEAGLEERHTLPTGHQRETRAGRERLSASRVESE